MLSLEIKQVPVFTVPESLNLYGDRENNMGLCKPGPGCVSKQGFLTFKTLGLNSHTIQVFSTLADCYETLADCYGSFSNISVWDLDPGQIIDLSEDRFDVQPGLKITNCKSIPQRMLMAL